MKEKGRRKGRGSERIAREEPKKKGCCGEKTGRGFSFWCKTDRSNFLLEGVRAPD